MLTLILLAMAIGYLIVVIIIIYFLSKFVKKIACRWAFSLVLFVLFLFLPFADQILGRYYFEDLCEKEGGLHVFESVELGPEYYNEDGSPRFMDDKGKFDSSVFNGAYEFKRESQEHYVEFVRIKKRTDSIVDNNSNKVLGSYSIFFYFGGWLANNFSHHVSGTVCKGYSVGGGRYIEFIQHVLISSQNNRG